MDGKKDSNNNGEKKKDETENLTRLEQDILAKNQGRSSRSGAISVETLDRPSADLTQFKQDVAAVNPSAGLSQLEQDVAAKQSSRGGAPSRPGAVSVNTGGAVTSGASTLSQLERDIVAKTQASHGGGATRPGYANE